MKKEILHSVFNCGQFDIFHSQKDSIYLTCMNCGKVTYFRWKSFWRRLKELF